jgi:large subunit ribosomal protein L6
VQAREVASAMMATMASTSVRRVTTAEGASVKQSRVGKKPVVIPDKVKVTVSGQSVSVKGPKGELKRTFQDCVKVVDNAGKSVSVSIRDQSLQARKSHGLARQLLQNMVTGVDKGYDISLQLNGVGYRAAVKGSSIEMALGYSHPVIVPLPQGVTAAMDGTTKLKLSSHDKELLGNFAANVRSKRPPEPYKGKGVKYEDEVIIMKEGKKSK